MEMGILFQFGIHFHNFVRTVGRGLPFALELLAWWKWSLQPQLQSSHAINWICLQMKPTHRKGGRGMKVYNTNVINNDPHFTVEHRTEYWKEGRFIFGFGLADMGHQPKPKIKMVGTLIWLNIVAFIFLIIFVYSPNSLVSDFLRKVPSSWCLVVPLPQIPCLISSQHKTLSKSQGLGFPLFLTWEFSHVADHLWLFNPRWSRWQLPTREHKA